LLPPFFQLIFELKLVLEQQVRLQRLLEQLQLEQQLVLKQPEQKLKLELKLILAQDRTK